MNEINYTLNEHKNNKRLVQSINQSMIKKIHDVFNESISITYIFNMFFGLSLDDQ